MAVICGKSKACKWGKNGGEGKLSSSELTLVLVVGVGGWVLLLLLLVVGEGVACGLVGLVALRVVRFGLEGAVALLELPVFGAGLVTGGGLLMGTSSSLEVVFLEKEDKKDMVDGGLVERLCVWRLFWSEKK